MIAGDTATRRTRRRAVLACVAVLLLALVNAPTPARADSGWRPPVLDIDVPDPSLVRVGNTFYSFTTNVNPFGTPINVPVHESSNLTSWKDDGDALPTLGSWASIGFTWAPSVAHIGDQWALYYTALHTSSRRQCIGVAVASQPQGPYTDDNSAPLVCQLDHGGSIDPSPFLDSAGHWWLLWKSDDNSQGGVPGLWSQRLGSDGRTLSGNPKEVLVADRPWENGLVEAPTMISAGGKLLLFYSAGPFDSDEYAVGYATCSSPNGPCAKQTVNGSWASTGSTGLVGPGGESFVTTASGRVDMALHGWRGAIGYENNGFRAMYIEPVDFSDGIPVVRTDWPRTGSAFPVPGPVIASRGDGSIDLMMTGPSGSLYRRPFDDGVWGEWDSVGGATTSTPAATWIAGTLHVFVRGTDGALWHRWFTGSAWSNWESLGGSIIGSPTIVSMAPGRLDVFAQGTDGALWHRWFTGSAWSNWESLGGSIIGSPTIVSMAPGRLDVFAQGTDGALWHRWFSDGWATWEPLGGLLVGGPGAVSDSSGDLDVFVQGTDGAMWHRGFASAGWAGWGAWEPFGGRIMSDPSATATGSGQIAVTAGGGDGDAWARTLSGSAWTGWFPLGASS
jgi:GH43 family beta-xylosidase